MLARAPRGDYIFGIDCNCYSTDFTFHRSNFYLDFEHAFIVQVKSEPACLILSSDKFDRIIPRLTFGQSAIV